MAVCGFKRAAVVAVRTVSRSASSGWVRGQQCQARVWRGDRVAAAAVCSSSLCNAWQTQRQFSTNSGDSGPPKKPWTPGPLSRKMIKGTLKLLGYYGDAATRERQSLALYQSIQEQASQRTWFDGQLGLPDEFGTRQALVQLHVWMAHNRLVADYNDGGKELIEELFDRLWDDTKRQLRHEGTPELMINKYLTEAQSLAFGAMTSYDHGLATTDDDEHAFGSALWRNVFDHRQVPDEDVLLLVTYCRKEIASLHKMPRVEFMSGLIPWGPCVGESVADRRKRQANLREGEWREAVSEGGETYYWHTRTREATWTRPKDFVAATPAATDATVQGDGEGEGEAPKQ